MKRKLCVLAVAPAGVKVCNWRSDAKREWVEPHDAVRPMVTHRVEVGDLLQSSAFCGRVPGRDDPDAWGIPWGNKRPKARTWRVVSVDTIGIHGGGPITRNVELEDVATGLPMCGSYGETQWTVENIRATEQYPGRPTCGCRI